MQTENERLNEAICNLRSSMIEFGAALGECVLAAARTVSKTLKSVSFIAVAYSKAEREHPEWIHKAQYSKKRRIRKKYHDRIMREYWGCNNG